MLIPMILGSPALAQSPPPLRISGRVVRGTDSSAVRGITVDLHRITADSGSVLATSVTGRNGRFAFTVPSPRSEPGRPPPVLLATARYQNVLYMGRALHGTPESIQDYRIVVYDARRADTVAVASRHTIVSPRPGLLDVVDVWELANDSDLTLVPGKSDAEGWRLPLPREAVEPSLVPGSALAGEDEVDGSFVQVRAPVPPGGRPLTVRYRIAADRIDLPAPGEEGKREVLVAGSNRPSRLRGLQFGGLIEIEGRTFQRYVSRGTPATLSMDFGPPPSHSFYAWIFVAAGFLLLSAAEVARRRLAAAG